MNAIRIGAALAAVALGVGVALGADGDAPAKSAAEQMEVAKKAKQAAHKQDGDEKRKGLEASVAAYREVIDRFPDEGETCAEAAFRIGEIERALGATSEAQAAFETAVRYSAASPRFAARAINELGHLARREGRLQDAVATYRRVLDEHGDEDAEAVKALTWIGKVELKLGRKQDARRSWLSIADRYPSEASAAIRAIDLAAISALDEGDAAEARRIVDEADHRFAKENEEFAFWTPDVDEALAKMKSRARLAGESD